MESYEFRPVQPVEPIAPWLGGKRHLAQHLSGLISAIPHRTYVEPFMGMGGVFLRRPFAAPAEVINDINRDLVTLYRVAQRHPAALADAFGKWVLSSRELFEHLKATPPEILTDVERAARFLYLQRMSFGGRAKNVSLGVDLRDGSRLRLRQIHRQLDLLHQRLDGVIIECLRWQEIIDRYDRPETLFYLDPPYWGGEADYGKGIFARNEFSEMAKRLAAIDGRFVLSINDNPDTRRLFGAFHLEERTINYSIGSKEGGGVDARELIVRDGKGERAGPLFAF